MRELPITVRPPADDVHLGTFGLLTLGERFAKVISERGR